MQRFREKYDTRKKLRKERERENKERKLEEESDYGKERKRRKRSFVLKRKNVIETNHEKEKQLSEERRRQEFDAIFLKEQLYMRHLKKKAAQTMVSKINQYTRVGQSERNRDGNN